MNESLRYILNRLEKELVGKIETLRSDLVPLERELADVRRARAALVKPGDVEIIVPTGKITIGPRVKEKESPYRHLTMKQLTVKALEEHFQNGATAVQLLGFFADAWDRTDIRRSSFSPQLSRLKLERKISRRGKTWYLEPPERDETPDVDPSDASDDGGGSPSPVESREIYDLLD